MNPLQLSQQQRITAAAGRNIDAGYYYVTDPSPNDVLLGRGSNLVRYKGNIDFRRLIQSKRDEYTYAVQTGRNKDDIAQEIVNVVISNNGRFLRKVTDQEERRKLNLPTNIPVAAAIWVPVSKKVALEKVKQAFRDSHKHFDPSIEDIDDTKPSALGTTSATTATSVIAGTTINTSDKSRQHDTQPLPASSDAEYSLESLVAQTLRRYQQEQMQKQQSLQKGESELHGAADIVPSAPNIASDTGIDASVAGTNPYLNRPIE